jgi:signal peptidase I
MVPALWPGDRIAVWRPPAFLWRPRRGDIVLARWRAGQAPVLKRVVGLPGESVKLDGGQVIIDGEPLPEPYLPASPVEAGDHYEWQLGPGEYVVLGDYRARSQDSRAHGPLPLTGILGKAWYRYAPGSRSGWLGGPSGDGLT